MTKEIVHQQQMPSLTERMNYAKALATADLLPPAYRNKPGNVLLAVEHGQALGIPPMTAIQGVHIIQGKPTLSADLMAALVRRAGHRLRVTTDAEPSATATLIRSDDPDFTYEATWNLDRARSAALLGKDTWKQHPTAMLKARAISEVIREGASEVLHGLIYTPEEMGAEVDSDGEVSPPAPETASQTTHDAEEIVDAEVVEGVNGDTTGRPHIEPTAAQLRMLGTLMTRNGISVKADRLDYCDRVIGHPIESSKDLTPDEFQAVIKALQADLEVIEAADAAAPDDAAAADQPPTTDDGGAR